MDPQHLSSHQRSEYDQRKKHKYRETTSSSLKSYNKGRHLLSSPEIQNGSQKDQQKSQIRGETRYGEISRKKITVATNLFITGSKTVQSMQETTSMRKTKRQKNLMDH